MTLDLFSTAQQQLEHRCVITIIFPLKAKHSTAPDTIKGKKKTEPEADLFQPENQKLSKFESNVEDNSASLSDFIPALQMLAWSALLFGIAGYISYRIYRKEA